jgi:hypothetical protein
MTAKSSKKIDACLLYADLLAQLRQYQQRLLLQQKMSDLN